MTAKERLRDLIEDLTEDEAEAWLEKMETVQDDNWRPAWLVKLDAMLAEIPEEELANLPPPDKIDEVLYGNG